MTNLAEITFVAFLQNTSLSDLILITTTEINSLFKIKDCSINKSRTSTLALKMPPQNVANEKEECCVQQYQEKILNF